jgi:opacity protein-like surface antigen
MDMKRLVVLCTALMVIATAASASDLALYGSYWNTDELDDTWGAGARGRMGSGDPLYLELRGTYFSDLTENDAVDLRTIPADLGLGLALIKEQDIELSVIGGGTYYFLDTDDFDVDDEIGWYAGAGAQVQLRQGLCIFAEFLYRDVEATVEDDDLGSIDDDTVDVDLAGSMVNIGLVFQ